MTDITYDIKFFFPYDKIILDDISYADMLIFKDAIAAGRMFNVHVGVELSYVINPTMVTYMKIEHHKPF